MTISSRIARPMLASMFVAGGLDAVRNPDPKVKAAEAVVAPLARRFPLLERDTATIVKFNGAIQVAGGLLLSIGKFRRLAALSLIGSLLPTTYAGHRFWEEHDEASVQQQRVHFLKNLGLLGGLVLAATDTEGAPSLSWRTRRRIGRAGDSLNSTRHAFVGGALSAPQSVIQTGRDKAARASEQVHGVVHRAGESVSVPAARVSQSANKARRRAAARVGAADVGGHLASVPAAAVGAAQRLHERLPI